MLQRQPSDSRPTGATLLLTAAALAVVAGLAISAGYGDERVVAYTTEVLRVLAPALFFGAGVIRITRWRLTGDAGVALVVFGGLTYPLSVVGGVLHEAESVVALSPLTRGLTTVVAGGLVIAALRAPRVDPNLRPGRLTSIMLTIPVVGVLLLLVWRHVLDLGLDPGVWTQTAIELLLASGWVALAVAAGRVTRRGAQTWAVMGAPLLAGMAVVHVLRAAAVHDPATWRLSSAMLAAAIAALVLAGAMIELSTTTTQQRRRLQMISSALERSEQVLSARDDWQQELSHDARNAMAALRMTLTTLTQYGERLAPATADQLVAGVLSEISHLEHLINRTTDEKATEDFDVETLIRPIAAAQRFTGLDVSVQTEGSRAQGRPADLTTVVQNVLVNAHAHGAGSAVSVRVSEVGDRVQILVEDRGPGMPDKQRRSACERGVRGEQSSGSGLGLYVARTLMLEQDGEIQLRDRPGGGTIVVLTLPAAEDRANSAPASPLEPAAAAS